MPAGTYNIVIDQGSDFAIQLTLSEEEIPKNLTGYSARAQMRRTKASDTISATFTCEVRDEANGIIVMSLGNQETVNLDSGLYYYDLEVYTENDANVTRLIEGQVTLTQEITR